MTRGLTNKKIAERLGSSPATVKNQIYVLFKKTGANNRTELAYSVSAGR